MPKSGLLFDSEFEGLTVLNVLPANFDVYALERSNGILIRVAKSCGPLKGSWKGYYARGG